MSKLKGGRGGQGRKRGKREERGTEENTTTRAENTWPAALHVLVPHKEDFVQSRRPSAAARPSSAVGMLRARAVWSSRASLSTASRTAECPFRLMPAGNVTAYNASHSCQKKGRTAASQLLSLQCSPSRGVGDTSSRAQTYLDCCSEPCACPLRRTATTGLTVPW